VMLEPTIIAVLQLLVLLETPPKIAEHTPDAEFNLPPPITEY
jgi:hypothetical protein